jgi:hypothetical protein
VVLLEPIYDFLKRGISRELEPVPKRPLHIAILKHSRQEECTACHSRGNTHLLLRSGNRIREPEEWQGDIDESVLVLLQISLAINDLVQLQAHKTRDERSGSGNSGNNLACDLFGRVPVGGVDCIVGSAKVGCGGDKVDVVVGVVILFEVDGD